MKHLRATKYHAKIVALAGRKGFKSLSQLHREFRPILPCGWNQFLEATKDEPESSPKLILIREKVYAYLNSLPDAEKPDTFSERVNNAGLRIEDLHALYCARYPDTTFGTERFRMAINAPYTPSEYAISRKATEILEEIEQGK